MTDQTPQMITLTDAAVDRVKTLIDNSDEPVLGLRVGISTKGCSGMSYVFEYAKEKQPYEEEIDTKGAKVFIDPMATMYLVGAEMDYVEDKMKSGFVFSNPNEKSRCGCGESFNV
ncbi:MAG TPA: iron-sulfur cluster assembly accessory protein [Rhodospirillales bacterium]|jgi:iron-sulfur cluster assembly protein|nr:MAG: Fe-S cluster assembly scaffold SufA [Rhodospirillaceae bacterium]PPR72200.1 MAG: Iron-binding protein IscA [Alphaproteobacteria bacterium MarineAlpha3_Bin2]HIM25840.1 iron-sulfur cluster assembly accessory protein [Rhodospirillales bacterium]